MNLFEVTLVFSTLLCSLVAGILFTFTFVVMPGIKSTTNREFLNSFKLIDGVIQRNQPAFMLVWVGSILIIIASVLLSISKLDGVEFLLIIIASALYLFGVQWPTFAINVPLNNWIQSKNISLMTDSEIYEARVKFEPRWLKWNSIRTVFAILTSGLLIMLVFKI